MRHGKKNNHLSRTYGHRQALLSNLASSLIIHKRIETTVAKAKELRKYVEPLLTKSKEDTTHSRRVVFSYLQNKDSVKELFDNIAEKISSRPGGYTRIIKTGSRLGDNAEICVMELVDYNLIYNGKEGKQAKQKTRRGRKSSVKANASTAEEVKSIENTTSTKPSKAPKAEAVKPSTAEPVPTASTTVVTEETAENTTQNAASPDASVSIDTPTSDNTIVTDNNAEVKTDEASTESNESEDMPK